MVRIEGRMRQPLASPVQPFILNTERTHDLDEAPEHRGERDRTVGISAILECRMYRRTISTRTRRCSHFARVSSGQVRRDKQQERRGLFQQSHGLHQGQMISR